MKARPVLRELWRYPIKSFRGERLGSLELDAHGVAGDRRRAFRSTAAPVGKPLLSSRERTRAIPLDPHSPEAELMSAIAEPGAVLTLLRSDTPLTDVRPIALHTLASLHALSAELGYTVDGRRFRSNLVLDALAEEEAHPGLVLTAPSGARLRLTEPIPRCRLVTLSPDNTLSPDAAAHGLALLRHLQRHHAGRFGWYARVVTPGILHQGDALHSTQAEPVGPAV